MRINSVWMVVLVGCGSAEPVSSHDEPLSTQQCSYFAVDDKVTICHATGSSAHPFTILQTSAASCAGHADHAGDYVAVGDPTCAGLGCFPENAPWDGSAPCCEGLSPEGGTCRAPSCPLWFGGIDSYYVGPFPNDVAVGDLDGDGDLDIAAAVSNAQRVAVMLGDGDRGFSAPVPYDAAPGGGPSSVEIADLDADGANDLVAAGLGGLFVLRGNGDGTFEAAVSYETGFGAYAVAIGNVDQDAHLDLVAVSQSDTLWVLRGNGDGTFQPAVSYTTAPGSSSVALGDFNEDGRIDAATANYFGTTTSVLLGNGDGTFQTAVDHEAGPGPLSVAIADLDGDGHLDLATANHHNGEISILLGAGDGTFAPAVNYAAGAFGFSIAVADLNIDGIPDLVMAGLFVVEVLQGNGDGTFRSPGFLPAAGLPVAVATGDLDHDGKPDIVSGSANDNPISVIWSLPCP